MIRVGVIFGGVSVEHEVSIVTAVQAMENFDQSKYQVIPIYISKQGIWYTGELLKNIDNFKYLEQIPMYAKEICLIKKNNEFVLQKTKGIFKTVITSIDVAVPIVHGKGVEDGSLAGYLEMVGVPYTSSSTLGASIGQDKVVQKQLLEANNINVPKYKWFYDYEYLENENKIIKDIEKLKYPVIVKPARLGSSIGISFANNILDLKDAIDDAIIYDNKIIVEEVIQNLKEINCAVIGNYEEQETSPLAQYVTSNDFLTFEDKYISGGKKGGSKSGSKNGKMMTSGFEIPAKIDDSIAKEVTETSIEAFKLMNLRGITRFDYLVDTKTKKVYLNEPNTIPGALSFFFFKEKEYKDLLDKMIKITIKEYKQEAKRTTNFDSNILSTYKNGGSKNNTKKSN